MGGGASNGAVLLTSFIVKELDMVLFKSETLSCSEKLSGTNLDDNAEGRRVAAATDAAEMAADEDDADTVFSKSSILAKRSLPLSSALCACLLAT